MIVKEKKDRMQIPDPDNIKIFTQKAIYLQKKTFLERKENLRFSAPVFLPVFYFFFDPYRIESPFSILPYLPQGSAYVFRHFGDSHLKKMAFSLSEICRRRKIRLFIGADPELAFAVKAYGVHMPERLSRHLPHIRYRFPNLVCTLSIHGLRALKPSIVLQADGFFLSPVFSTPYQTENPIVTENSRKTGKPNKGQVQTEALLKFQAYLNSFPRPVFALGGVTPETVKRLPVSFSGFAVVSALFKKHLKA